LKVCNQNNITPKYLYYLKTQNIDLYDHRLVHKYNCLNNSYIFKILKIELMHLEQYTSQALKFSDLRESCPSFSLSLSLSLSRAIFQLTSFFSKRTRIIIVLFLSKRKIQQNSRFIKQTETKHRQKDIKKIEYFWYNRKNENSHSNVINNTKHFSFSPPPTLSTNEVNIINVNLYLLNYTNINKFNLLKSNNNKWFINLSQCNIPLKVQCLLQLGPNYSLPARNTNKNITQLIKNIENNIINLYTDTQDMIWNRSIYLIQSLRPPIQYLHQTEVKIANLIKITDKFIKNNPNIIYTRVDKGNIIVTLNKTEYINKIEEMLSDKDMYDIIAKDPTKKLTNDIKSLLAGWKTKGGITNTTYNSIYCSDGNLPKANGLPKIHKPGFNFRLIVSSIDGPTK